MVSVKVMERFYGFIYIVLVVFVFSGCDPEPASVDGQYKRRCFNRLDEAVDLCKSSPVDAMDSCYRAIFLIDTVQGIDKNIWRGYAHAKGLFHHSFFKESLKVMNELIRDTSDPSLLLEHARLLQLRGSMEAIENEQTAAAKDYYKSINIYRQLGLEKDVAICYADVANIHNKVQNFKLAIENGHHALAVRPVDHADTMRCLNVYNTMALSFIPLHLQDSALYYFRLAEDLAIREKAEFWIGLINGNMAVILMKQGHLKEALAKLTIDMRVSLKYNENVSAATALMSKGEIYATQGKISMAQQCFDSAYSLLQTKIGDKVVLGLYYKKMAQFSRDQQKYKDADEYFQKFIHLRDSLDRVNVGQNVEQIQNKSYMEKQLADINLLRMENGYRTKQVRLWQLSIGAIACALVLIVVLYRNKRIHNKQLKRLNNQLEEIVKDRTAELMKTNEELDTYLYRASHDVRRPILSVIGLAQIAEFAVSADERTDIQRKIISTAQEMDKMLNKLKMTYELRATVEPETFDLFQYIEDLSRNVGKSYPHTKFTLTKSGDVTFASDMRFITMVFLNLLENACIFCRVNAPVNIEVTGELDYLYVRVTDQGIGIQEEYLDRIFEAYTRFSERSVGSGIGLYIVSRALAKIGGRVQVESVLHEGSTFTVKLPRWKYSDL